MIAEPKRESMTPEAYLEWEAQQPLKYEYIQGQAYATTGGTLPHSDIAVNLTAALKPFLRRKGCKVRMAAAKVGITEQGPYFYPDIVVSCDQRDRKALKLVRYPQLIAEVLSPRTEGFDRESRFSLFPIPAL
jgi:Uma2 family endonuclease